MGVAEKPPLTVCSDLLARPAVDKRVPQGDPVPLPPPPTDGVSLPRPDGPDERIAALPQFVTVVGGAYFFLPGLRALRWLAGAQRGGSP